MKKKKFQLKCPHCHARMVVDNSTGEILSSEAAGKKGKLSLDDRLQALDKEKQRSEEKFTQQMEALEGKSRALEEKFDKALQNVKKEDIKKPLRDVDLD